MVPCCERPDVEYYGEDGSLDVGLLDAIIREYYAEWRAFRARRHLPLCRSLNDFRTNWKACGCQCHRKGGAKHGA